MGGAHPFDPAKPWDHVFRAAVEDDKFWATEVTNKAVLFAARFRSQAQLADPGHGAPCTALAVRAPAPKAKTPRQDWRRPGPYGSGGAKGKEKGTVQHPLPRDKGGKDRAGKHDKGKGKGNFRVDAQGAEICFSWNRSANGCTPSGPCSNGRVHVCEMCLGSHRAVACPKQS